MRDFTDELREQLLPDHQRIIQSVCMSWSAVELHAMQGGFSGSVLMLGHGFKGQARTEPLVIKVDHAEQMQREIDEQEAGRG